MDKMRFASGVSDGGRGHMDKMRFAIWVGGSLQHMDGLQSNRKSKT